MRDPQIVFIDQSGQPGGAELCLADLAQAVSPAARVILFADGPFAESLRTQGVSTTVLPLPGLAARATKRSSLGALSALPAMLRHVAALRRAYHGANVVYFNTAKALVHGVAANFDRAYPSIFHLHDLIDPQHFSRTNIRLLVAAANRTDAVIANSPATAEAYRRHGGRTPAHVIPNGFDPGRFAPRDPASIASLRHKYNPAGRTVAAIFGRLTRWKGQDVLLRAAAEIPDMQIWVVGDAFFTDDDRAYAGELRHLAAPLGDRVTFLGFREDVPAFMQAADIVVHASVAPEPFGRVIVEAMFSGRPVVATAAGGPAEILTDHKTGLLVAPGDAPAMAAALAGLCAKPVLRESLAEAARHCAHERYTLSKVVAETRSLVAEVCRRSRP